MAIGGKRHCRAAARWPSARRGTAPSTGRLGNNHLAQADQVAANALIVLAAAGARPADVVRSVIYVVSDDNQVLDAVWRRLNDSALGPAFGSASTLLGVASLGFTGQLIELDLTAALPG
ncbi:RidA family protein [Sorangium sp. So ce1153]|uniref:RidA family protein n=1 Tax=Sorangium sp. So ce1153 TaxID=3133333 RepID=UPI003F643906